VGQGRDVGIVMESGSPAFVQTTVDAVIAVMIEKRGAVEELEEILAVDGVDMVQFGPSDYSLSIGVPGQRRHPAVVEAEHHVIETALRMGVAPRVEVQELAQAEPYLEMGVHHFCLGLDMRTLFYYWRDNGARMREMMDAG
jgi:4-hydroxy-2-oxoheptanedioate aldolase